MRPAASEVIVRGTARDLLVPEHWRDGIDRRKARSSCLTISVMRPADGLAGDGAASVGRGGSRRRARSSRGTICACATGPSTSAVMPATCSRSSRARRPTCRATTRCTGAKRSRRRVTSIATASGSPTSTGRCTSGAYRLLHSPELVVYQGRSAGFRRLHAPAPRARPRLRPPARRAVLAAPERGSGSRSQWSCRSSSSHGRRARCSRGAASGALVLVAARDPRVRRRVGRRGGRRASG